METAGPRSSSTGSRIVRGDGRRCGYVRRRNTKSASPTRASGRPPVLRSPTGRRAPGRAGQRQCAARDSCSMTDAADASRQQGGLVAGRRDGRAGTAVRRSRPGAAGAASPPSGGGRPRGCLLLVSGARQGSASRASWRSWPGCSVSRAGGCSSAAAGSMAARPPTGRGCRSSGRPAGELLECLPSTPTAADPEAARFLLFDAVGRFLREVADSGPVLVVLDDLHAAVGLALAGADGLARPGRPPAIRLARAGPGRAARGRRARCGRRCWPRLATELYPSGEVERRIRLRGRGGRGDGAARVG